MKHIKYFCLTLVVFLLIIGCSRNNVIKNLPESESKAIQKELLDTWADYDIHYSSGILVFDPKNDDKKILVPRGNLFGFYTVKDQETWTQIVNGTIPHNNINMVWGEPMREIWVNNQFYGYVITFEVDDYFAGPLAVSVVDDNTVWLTNF